MVRVRAPLFSFGAQGWLGKDLYARHGIVRNPYPIGMFNFRYGILWESGTWADKRVAWSATNWTWDGHRPNLPRAFLSFYYNKRGWCYQRRRTWHGIIWSAMRGYVPANPQTAPQQANRALFANAVSAWQALSGLEKGVWNSYNYPKHPSGYNRFISAYLKDKPGLVK